MLIALFQSLPAPGTLVAYADTNLKSISVERSTASVETAWRTVVWIGKSPDGTRYRAEVGFFPDRATFEAAAEMRYGQSTTYWNNQQRPVDMETSRLYFSWTTDGPHVKLRTYEPGFGIEVDIETDQHLRKTVEMGQVASEIKSLVTQKQIPTSPFEKVTAMVGAGMRAFRIHREAGISIGSVDWKGGQTSVAIGKDSKALDAFVASRPGAIRGKTSAVAGDSAAELIKALG